MDWQVIVVISSFIGMLVGMWSIVQTLRKDLQSTKDVMFAGFDRHKENVDKKLMWIQNNADEKFMRVDLCNEIHKNIQGRLKSIETKIDALLTERK